MQELWTAYGFYLWALTTALVIIALAWLAWDTFAPQPEAVGETAAVAVHMDDLEARVAALTEAAPYMQATLGRSLQFCGLVRQAESAFSLAVADARGNGFILSRFTPDGLSAKPLTGWTSDLPLSPEERAAIEHAREQKEQKL